MVRKLRKKLFIGVLIVLALVVLGVVLLVLNLDNIAAIGITKGGSAILGVPVTLDNADVSLWGTLDLEGLCVGSPEGYNAPAMFTSDHVHVEADVISLFGDERLLHDVRFDRADVTFELSGGKSNWGVLLKRLERKAETTEKADETTMRIDHVIFQNAKAHLAGIPGTGDVTVPLPEVELHDIGKEKEGRTVPETMLLVVRSLYAIILKASRDLLPTEQVKKLADEVGGHIGRAVGGAASGAAGEGKKAWDSLFGGEEDAEE